MRKLALAAALSLLAMVTGTDPAAAVGCFPVAQEAPRLIPAALPAGATLQLTFLGHSSFLIETAQGATAVTDYNGMIRAPSTPDIVTMNNAHSTHYAFTVEPGVRHVLRGWSETGGIARHDVSHEGLRVRNVPTSVRGRTGAEANSNSIFVFETEDLCVAHLGHLHHVLTDMHLAELGVIDIALVPVDGAYTMSQEEMVEVIRQIRPSVVIPMHYFAADTLARFLRQVEGAYEVVMSETPTVAFSRQTLPHNQVLVLPGS